MNCKQAEELLPLYAGRDLDENRASLVTKHMLACAVCAGLADEYRESVQLTEQFKPPVLSEAVYAGIRRRVLIEIETEARAPTWLQTKASLFRPRLLWAIASVLLIGVSLFAIYFILNRRNDGQQLADTPPTKIQTGTKERSNSGSQDDKRADLSPSVNRGGTVQQLAGVPQPQRKRSRHSLSDRMKTVGAKSPDSTSKARNVSLQPSNLRESMLFPPRDSAALGKTLRVEIQTKDPNIRIIWFAQQETNVVIPSPKRT